MEAVVTTFTVAAIVSGTLALMIGHIGVRMMYKQSAAYPQTYWPDLVSGVLLTIGATALGLLTVVFVVHAIVFSWAPKPRPAPIKMSAESQIVLWEQEHPAIRFAEVQ